MIPGREWKPGDRIVLIPIGCRSLGELHATDADILGGGNREFDLIVTDGNDFDEDLIADLNTLMRFAR